MIKKLKENNSLVIIDMFQIIKQLSDKFEQEQGEKFCEFLDERIYSSCNNQQEICLF